MRFVACPATEYDEVLSGYQRGQMVEWWKKTFRRPFLSSPSGY